MEQQDSDDVVVLLYSGCTVAEVIELATRLTNNGFAVTFAAAGVATRDSLPDQSGLLLTPDCLVGEVEVESTGLVIVPGGDPGSIMGDEVVAALIADVWHQGGIVAGICAGVLVMADAGVLEGRRITHNYRAPWAPPEIESFVEKYWAGAVVEPDPAIGVVVDDRVVTALPNATIDFSSTVCELLGVHDKPKAAPIRRHLVGEYLPELTTRDGGLSPEARIWLAERLAQRNADGAANPSEARLNPATVAEDRAATLADWHQTSQRAIERHGVVVSDETVNGIDCLRVTCPSAGTEGGLMMYIFGGGFMFGDPFSELPIVAALARYAAIEVILPHYRLAPEHPAPAASDDCYAVWTDLRSRHDSLALGGESAGGNLALVTAIRGRDDGLAAPSALALLSPAVDLRVGEEQLADAPDDPTLGVETMFDVARYYAGPLGDEHRWVSPIFDSLRDLPPTFVTTGTRDMLLPGCLRLARKMHRAGVDVDCRVWPGLWHVFEFYDAYPEADESLAEVARFLTSHLGSGQAAQPDR